jgi:ABC-type multidrug transport system fused ATPase/permease subunit
LKKVLKRYFENLVYFYNHIGFSIFTQMGLSIIVGILDGFGLAMFLPLLQMVDNPNSVDKKKLGNLDFIVSFMDSLNINLNLLTVLIFLLLFFLLKGVAQYISGMHAVGIRQLFAKKIRLELIKGLSQISYKKFVQSDPGTIQNTLSGEVDRVARAYQTYLAAFQFVIMVIVYMSFAFFVEPKFAILISIGGLLTNLIYKHIYTNTKGASKKLTTQSHVFQGLVIQFVSNFKYLKATGSLDIYGEKLVKSVNKLEENNRIIGKLGTILTASKEPLLILVVCSVIYIQIDLLGSALGPILISLLFFYRALAALISMQVQYNLFLGVSGSLFNMGDFNANLQRSKEDRGAKVFTALKDEIHLSNAVFSYNQAIVIDGVDLKIKKNETVAFVGESGSGKTTLVNVLAGLVPLDEGIMTVDGIAVRELDMNTYQKNIGYITQEPVIFNDTIFNNITFWAPYDELTLKRFNIAVKQASVTTFLDELPHRELTMLGSEGVNLSGGQKQRISIARELFKNVNILVFDEATSALDSETERSIQENIEALHGNFTIFIVAHRLSTIRHADRVILMSKGKILSQGSFSYLVRNSPPFKKMVDLQDIDV